MSSIRPETFLVVGAGFFGATVAHCLAVQFGCRVIVLDKKSHPGGCSWSEKEPGTDIECHRYGSHIFHTTDKEVYEFITKFDTLNSYRHKVFTTCNDRVYTMPFNLKLLNDYFGLNLKPFEVEDFIKSKTGGADPETAKNFEEKAIRLIGPELYHAFIASYTEKQWGCPPEQLPAHIISRLPIYKNYRNDYFDTPWQGIPVHGYGELLKKMLSHPLIDVKLNTDYLMVKEQFPEDIPVIYSGQLDLYFDYCFGALEWRSLNFEWETVPCQDYQGTAVMNYAELEIPYTRVHEFKHYHPERVDIYTSSKTVICREYPSRFLNGMEPFYPVNTDQNNQLYRKYLQLAEQKNDFFVGGRLGAYQYFDMDKTIRNGLNLVQQLKQKYFSK